MFRLLRIRPPNGWSAVAWELVIVTLGVLIALAAQQWANNREWHGKVRQSQAALKTELADHYAWSVEWRVVKPCLVAQIDALAQRVQASGHQLNPAPIHSEPNLSYVIRLPSKEYITSAWDSAQVDGTSARYDAAVRRELSSHYIQVRKLSDLTDRNGVDDRQLLALSRPIELEPIVRHSIMQTLDELRGRVDLVDTLSGHLIEHIVKLGWAPPKAETRREVERYNTIKFCLARRLPLRSLEEAMVPLPN